MTASGQKAKYSLGADVFRFSPESGLKTDIAGCPVRAMTRLMHRSKQSLYSITSSARAAAAAEPDPHGIGPFGVAGSAKLTQSLDSAGG